MKRMALLTFCLLLLTLADLSADNISVLGSKPRWSVLENYQETITHDEFAPADATMFIALTGSLPI